ncbi:MAG: glycosyltransferase family 4 protein [Legionella sp.]|nr:glycosyltransferase family 4 protein [Legionella sp.]
MVKFNTNQRLCIDVTRLVRRQWQQLMPTGIDRLVLSYIQYYQDTAHAVFYYLGKCWIFPTAGSKKLFSLLLSGTSKRTLFASLIAGIIADLIKRKKNGRILLALGHSNLEKKRYIKSIKRLKLEPIFFIHDLIPITHPEYCRFSEKQKHTLRIIHALSLAKHIIVNSEVTQKGLLDFAGPIQNEPPLITVAHLGSELFIRNMQRDSDVICAVESALKKQVQTPYFVVLGTIEPRKNHLLLLHVWVRLIETMGQCAPRLFIIGRRGWECEHVTRMLDRCSLFQGFIFEWNQCTDEQLLECLRGSQALLFPSFVEGYGLPLVEALAMGIPVIASSIPVFKELAANIPEYIEPIDAIQWLSIITDYTSADSLLRKAQLERLAGYKAPTWANHFIAVDKLLRSIA